VSFEIPLRCVCCVYLVKLLFPQKHIERVTGAKRRLHLSSHWSAGFDSLFSKHHTQLKCTVLMKPIDAHTKSPRALTDDATETAVSQSIQAKRPRISGQTLALHCATPPVSSANALSGADFGFPYPQPYGTQLELMRAVYETIDRGGIGVFESPTGTGKTLSLLCAALTWIRQDRHRMGRTNDVHEEPSSQSEPDWLRDYEIASSSGSNSPMKYNSFVNSGTRSEPTRVMQFSIGRYSQGTRTEDPVIYSPVHSLDTNTSGSLGRASAASSGLVLFGDDDSAFAPDMPRQGMHPGRMPPPYRILYASRTHSQLSQFISEVRRTEYAKPDPTLATTVLASRKMMCIHPKVRMLRSAAAVNERCHELRNNQVKTAAAQQQSQCPFYQKERIRNLANVMHQQVCDLEDLLALGQQHQACPYYAARASLACAELIVMPYQTLLHETTRQSANVPVDQRTIVILDEAHNLVDALNEMHTTKLSIAEVTAMEATVSEFIEKQKTWKPDPDRSFHLEQLRRLLAALRQGMQPEDLSRRPSDPTRTRPLDKASDEHSPVVRSEIPEPGRDLQDDVILSEFCQTPSDFCFQMKIEQMNFSQLIRYLFSTKCMHMLQSLHESRRRTERSIESSAHSVLSEVASVHSNESPTLYGTGFYELASFLAALCEPRACGKVLTAPNRHIRYVLLDPIPYFSPIYRTARATILAGGTLEPREALLPRLFDEETCKQVYFSAFQHVVPQENVLALILGKGPTGLPLEFSFSQRQCMAQIDELGHCIVNLCALVPKGLVVFFPSYALERLVWTRFAETNISERIARRKEVFREQRGCDVDKLFNDYRSAVTALPAATERAELASPQERDGALLSAVIGGKLSEGINFADDLGRCVVVVGLPFPNARQTETRLVLHFLQERYPSSDLSREYLENACMIAVNQSVGRAIRHARDYAAVVFVDQRYAAQERLRFKLPRWLRGRVLEPRTFGDAIQQLASFFRNKC